MENDKPNEPDKRIRAKLDGNELKPDAALWNDIERELDKSKRRGIFFRKRYLLLLLLMFGGIGVFTFQHYNNVTESGRDNTNAHSNTVNNSISSKDNSHQGITNANSSDVSVHDQSSSSTNASSQTEKSLIATSNAKTETATHTTSNLATHSSNISTKDNRSVISKSTSSNVNDKIDLTTTQRNEVSNLRKESLGQSVDENVTSNNNVTATGNAASQSIDKTENETLSSTNNASSTNNGQSVNKNDTSSLQSPSLADNTIATTNLDSTKLATTYSVTHTIEETYTTNASSSKPAIKFYVGPYVQYDAISKKIGVNDNVRPEYLERRRSEETKTFTFSYGLKVGVDINRFNVQTGIGIRSYADNIQYENRKLCYDILNKGSQTVPLYDTIKVHSEVSNIVGTENGNASNRYIELPLLVGYRVGTDAFFIQPAIGIGFEFSSAWQSIYLNESVDGLVDPKKLNWVNPVVVDVLAELTASRSLAKNLFVSLGANYNHNASNVFRKRSGLIQRYSGYGGQLGLTYRF